MSRCASLAVFGVAALLCAAWTVSAGKDLSFDLLNYHYYVAYELLGGRLAQDFYAASAQSYLNPLGYLPFYLLASAWHSVLASIALAVLASASLALLYLLSWRLFAHRRERERLSFSLLATALGAATAVFWPMVGTSMLDPWLAALVLGALLLLVRHAPGTGTALLAGALLGTATALKYSNAVYGLAALALLFGRSWRVAGGYATGGLAAIALLAGPWFLALHAQFGSPLFPLFNAWFQSPYAPPINTVSARFLPADFLEAIALPFRMIAVSKDVYIETAAPDVRFAALLGAAAVLPLLGRRARGARFAAEDLRLFAFFAIAAVLWVLTSSNGRYGLVILLLAGVLLTRLVECLLPSSAARVVLALVLAVQLGMCLTASPSRWFAAEPWSRRWLAYDAPPRARREPVLYLSVEPLSMAVVAPFLDARSSFVNLRGHHSLPPDSPRLAALIAAHAGHLRTLGRKPDSRTYDLTFRRIGYRVSFADCFTIPWRPERDDTLSRWANALARRSPTDEPLSVVSCALLPVPRDPQEEAAARRVSALFDRIERACPDLFRGQTAVTDRLATGWARLYNELDARLELHGDHLLLNRYFRGQTINLGQVADWRGPVPRACGSGQLRR